MQVKQWWQLLHNDLEKFSNEHSTFAKIEQGQFSIIRRAAAVGITMTGGMSDQALGDQIKNIFSELKGNLPSIDPSYSASSRALMEIYLAHLKRYRQVHGDFAWWQIKGAKAVGVDLEKVNKDILEKDIPELESRLKSSTLSVEVKQEVKLVSLTVTTTMTATVSTTPPSRPTPTPEKIAPIDFSTARVDQISLYAEHKVREMEQELRSLKSRLGSLQKGRKVFVALIGAKKTKEERSDGYYHPDFKKLERDIGSCSDDIEKKEACLGHYKTIQNLAESKSENHQAIYNELVSHRTPLFVEEIISKVKDYKEFGAEIQSVILGILEATLQQPVMIQRILAESEKDYGPIVNSIASEINVLFANVWEDKSPGVLKHEFSILRLPFKHVDEILTKITMQVPGYDRLDQESRQAVDALLRAVLNKPNLFKTIMMHPNDEQIAAALAAPIRATLYDKWAGSEKGILLEGHGRTVIGLSKIFTQVQPLSAVLLEKAILAMQVVSPSVISSQSFS